MAEYTSLKRFFALEGVETSGKTTQANLIAEDLRRHGYTVLVTHEPGGSKLGAEIRRILLSPDFQGIIRPTTELLLFNASRFQWMEETVMPALKAEVVVVADRSKLSSVAYQGYGEGLDLDVVRSICSLAMGNHEPERIYLLDIGIEEMARRLEQSRGEKNTRYDRMDLSFHKKVRDGYLAEWKKFPRLIKRVDGERPVEAVTADLVKNILTLLEAR